MKQLKEFLIGVHPLVYMAALWIGIFILVWVGIKIYNFLFPDDEPENQN